MPFCKKYNGTRSHILGGYLLPLGRGSVGEVLFSYDVSLHQCNSGETIQHAGMVELADTQDLGSCGSYRGGSSPPTCTRSMEQRKSVMA